MNRPAKIAAPPIPTTTPMIVFLVLVLMPEEEDVWSLEREPTDVLSVVPVVVDEETEVTREPETVITEVIKATLVYDEVDVDVVCWVDETEVEELEEVKDCPFEVFDTALELLEEGGVEVEDGVELDCVEEGVEDGELLRLAVEDGVGVVETGVDDVCGVDEGAELCVEEAPLSTFEVLELELEEDEESTSMLRS